MSSSAEPRQTPHVDLSTPQSTPSQTRPANIPAQNFQVACEDLVRIIRPEDDDSRIQRSLGHIWFVVHDTLERDPELERQVSNKSEFFANVKRKGEKEFIDSLKVMAKSGAWAGLFEDGTLPSFFGSQHSDHVLCSDVFLKETPRVPSLNTDLISGTQYLRSRSTLS
jgi:hypothetical protein